MPAAIEIELGGMRHDHIQDRVNPLRESSSQTMILDRQAARDRCNLMGFEVRTINGTQALRRIRQGGIDTLIIDVQMPELDGLSCLRICSNIPKGPCM